jgi:hypothetical protein
MRTVGAVDESSAHVGGRMSACGGTPRRPETGAAAVEGALVSAFVLIPLLAGVLLWGSHFWKEQQVSLYPPRLSQSLAVGTCTASEISARVTSSAAEAIFALNTTTLNGLGITSAGDLASYLAVTVTSLPDVGADVTVSLSIPGEGAIGGLVPGSDAILADLTQRLSYVTVTTGSSSGTGCYP